MAEELQFPPLPKDCSRREELRQWNGEMLQMWRSRKDDYVRNYVMLGRWGQNPKHPVFSEWMTKLTYSPLRGQSDTRLPDPRTVFVLVHPVIEYLPSNAIWHRIEELRRIRENAINLNFDPSRLAVDAEKAVYSLFKLAELLEDRLLAAIHAQAQAEPAQRRKSDSRKTEEDLMEDHGKSSDAAKHYRIKDLISDLGSYGSIIERADKQMAKVDGALIAGSKNSYYVSTAHDYRRDAERIASRFNKQPGVEQLRLICESEGAEWSENWVKKKRATLCNAMGLGQSVVERMELETFVNAIRNEGGSAGRARELSSASSLDKTALRMQAVKSALQEVLEACEQELAVAERKSIPIRQPGQMLTSQTADLASIYLNSVGLSEDARLLKAEGEKFFQVVTDDFYCLASESMSPDEIMAFQESVGEFPVIPADPKEADRIRTASVSECRKFGGILCRHVKRVQGLLGGDIATDQPAFAGSVVDGQATPDGTDDSGFYGGSALRQRLKIPSGQESAFGKALERERKQLGDDNWQEVANPRPNQPRYLYRLSAVKELAKKYQDSV